MTIEEKLEIAVLCMNRVLAFHVLGFKLLHPDIAKEIRDTLIKIDAILHVP